VQITNGPLPNGLHDTGRNELGTDWQPYVHLRVNDVCGVDIFYVLDSHHVINYTQIK